MTPEDRDFTNAWWTRVCADNSHMTRWLQKLWQTERSGYDDNRQAAEDWGGGNAAVINIFHRTGDDEMAHAGLLERVLLSRNAWPVPEGIPESDYWMEMDDAITSLETCAAVFHLGEKLAAERFAVLLAHPDTPDDVRWFLEKALPEEEHHARVFLKLTTEEALAQVTIAHDAAVARLKTRKP